MAKQFKVIMLLLALTALSTWILYKVSLVSTGAAGGAANAPDYYMQDFSTLAMDANGNPDYKLYGVYMAHYPASDTTEIVKPRIDFLRPERPACWVWRPNAR